MTETATRRTSVEIEQQRAVAELRVGGASAYLDERCRAVLEVFDWVLRRPAAAPPAVLRERPEGADPARRPDPAGLSTELRQARSDEELARATGQPSRRPGVHAHALSWVLGEPGTEAPAW